MKKIGQILFGRHSKLRGLGYGLSVRILSHL